MTARRVSSGPLAPVRPSDIDLVRDGRLIHAADVKNVAQIHRRASAPHAHHGAEHVSFGFVFAGKLHREIASLGSHRAAGNHRVAGGNRVFHDLRGQTVAGQIGIRKEQIHRFLHDGHLGDFADALDLLEVILKIARQQLESAIAVTRRGRRSNLRQRILISHQQ